MRVSKDHDYAVVTGDVVGYTKLPKERRAYLIGVLREAHRRLRARYKGSVQSEIDVFRGDSWQFVIAKPDQSLRAALFFRAFLISQMDSKPMDTRLAIGIGPVDFVPSASTPTGDGVAFRRSGAALDRMPRGTRMLVEGPPVIAFMDSATLDVIVALLDALVREWTPRQAEAVCGAILGWKQEKIASEWSGGRISQQAVAQHLERARWSAIAKALEHFEARFTEGGRGGGTGG
jgi:hypothetical protein